METVLIAISGTSVLLAVIALCAFLSSKPLGAGSADAFAAELCAARRSTPRQTTRHSH